MMPNCLCGGVEHPTICKNCIGSKCWFCCARSAPPSSIYSMKDAYRFALKFDLS